MTLKELYTKLEGNYEDAVLRLNDDKQITGKLMEFLDNDTYGKLIQAGAARNTKRILRYAKELLAVSDTLAMTRLSESLYDVISAAESYANEEDSSNFQKAFNALTECYYKMWAQIDIYKIRISE